MLQNLSYYIFIENYLKYVIWLKFEALCWVKKFNTSSKYLKCCVPTHIYWYNLKSILLMHSINNSYGLQLQKNISKMLFYSLGNNYINENIIESDTHNDHVRYFVRSDKGMSMNFMVDLNITLVFKCKKRSYLILKMYLHIVPPFKILCMLHISFGRH